MGVLGRAAVTARLSWARGLESLSRVKLPSAQPEATSEAEHRPVPRGSLLPHTGLLQQPGNHLAWMCGYNATICAICCFKQEPMRSGVPV